MMSKTIEEKISMTPAELIHFRTVFKINQKQLAHVLGISWQAVDLWETGQRRIPETTNRILKLFLKYPTLITEFN